MSQYMESDFIPRGRPRDISLKLPTLQGSDYLLLPTHTTCIKPLTPPQLSLVG